MNSEVGSVVIVGALAEVEVVVLSTTDVSVTVSKVGACIVMSAVVVVVGACWDVAEEIRTAVVSVVGSDVSASAEV